MMMRAILGIIISVTAGCSDTGHEDPPPPELLLQGTVQYEKRLPGPETTVGLAPIAGARIQLIGLETGSILAESTTSPNGDYTFSQIDLQPIDVAVRVLAQYVGKAIDITVYSDEPMTAVWATEWSPTDTQDWIVVEPYAAGAFNILAMTNRVEEVMNSLVPQHPPTPLAVRWLAQKQMPCVACFHADKGILDLSGVLGDEDGHDDSVVLHELGHYIEDTWGIYDNPGGSHNRERTDPLLAWSEGFATWFQAMLRGQPDYVDRWPEGEYRLDLETPPPERLGIQGSLPAASMSEALVYALLWDLTDGGDDGESVQYPVEDVLSIVVGLTHIQDVGVAGADLLDFLNEWRCDHDSPDDEVALSILLESVGLPLDLAVAPQCPEADSSP